MKTTSMSPKSMVKGLASNVAAKSRAGQSLVEVLVALSIGALIIGGAVLSINIALRSNTANVGSAFAAPLARELIEKVRNIADGNWNTIYLLSPKGQSAEYWIDGNLDVQAGVETISESGKDYVRSFAVENVFRDDSGDIAAIGGTEDPSTQKITATVDWGTNSSLSVVEYITRNRNDVNSFSNWSSGEFDSQNGLDLTNQGEIKLAE